MTVRTTYDRDDLQGVLDHGGVEWEQNDRRLAMERAAMLRAASIDIERVRPARQPVRDDLTAARGFLIGFVLAAGFWAMFLVVAYLVTS